MKIDEKVIQQKVTELTQWFESRRKTLGFAESCTGGLLSSWVVAQPGVSSFFKGSVVSYSGGVKEGVLSVPRHMILGFGEVSTPVARHMAKGARKVLNVDWALSITGVAGPTGGSEEKPVGTVCFALCGPGVEKQEQKYFDGKQRTEIQYQSALYGLELLLATLKF